MDAIFTVKMLTRRCLTTVDSHNGVVSLLQNAATVKYSEAGINVDLLKFYVRSGVSNFADIKLDVAAALLEQHQHGVITPRCSGCV